MGILPHSQLQWRFRDKGIYDVQATAIFYATNIICSNRKHVPDSEFSLLVFPVHAYCLDINCADEI